MFVSESFQNINVKSPPSKYFRLMDKMLHVKAFKNKGIYKASLPNDDDE